MKIQKIISGVCLLTMAIALHFTAFCPTSQPSGTNYASWAPRPRIAGGTPYSWAPGPEKDRAIAEYERNKTMNTANELSEYDETGMMEENQSSGEFVGVWCNAPKLSAMRGARSQFSRPSFQWAGTTTFTRNVGGRTKRDGTISGGTQYHCQHFLVTPSKGNGWSLEQIKGNQFKLMVDTTMFKGIGSDQFVYQEGCHSNGKVGKVTGQKEGRFMSFTFFACPVHQEGNESGLAESGEFE